MALIRSTALLSCIAMAACGGGGSSSGGNAVAGFEARKPATLTFTAVAPSPLGSLSTSSNNAKYDPKAGTITTGHNGYAGPVREGEWRTDSRGNRILMTNPADTKFLRQVEMVEARGQKLWHRGVVGFETQSMPRSGNMTYRGTTSGEVMKFGTNGSGPTFTSFEGNVRVEADIASGKGSYRISGVRASDGTSDAPFRSLSSDISIEGSQISAIRNSTVLNSGPGQPLGEAWANSTNGGFYGPNATEVGAGYQVMAIGGRVNGAFVAKR